MDYPISEQSLSHSSREKGLSTSWLVIRAIILLARLLRYL